MTCSYCGGILEDGVKFCKYCGEPVTVLTTEPEQTDPSQEQTSKKAMNWYDFKKYVKTIAIILTAILTLIVFFFGIYKDDEAPSGAIQTSATTGDQREEDPQTLPKPEKLELVYTLTQEDVDSFYECLEVCEELCVTGQDLSAAEDKLEELDAAFAILEDQCAVANVLSCADTTDQSLSDQLLSATDHVTQANDAYLQMLRRIYQSQSPIREELFADWTQQELEMLLAYTDEVAALSKRNTELLVEYRALDLEEAEEDMIPLYTQMVLNNNRIAQIYGYDNYYIFAYQVEYRRDYSAQEVAAMRELAAQYLIPAGQNLLDQFAIDTEALRWTDQLALSRFIYSDFDESSYLENYLNSLPEETGSAMLDMFQGNGYFTQYQDALEGAFTTCVGDRLFCFFGPGYGNALTVAHELGHYYSGMYQDLEEIPLDLAETQSQGNEWLFIRFLKEEMSEDLYEAVVGYKMYSDLAVILVSLMVDEFEEQVYQHPDVSQLTREELEAIMESVCVKYGGVDTLSEYFTDIQSYWKLVVMEAPVYYISYSVSALGAMELYLDTQRDYSQVADTYAALCETPEMEFREALAAAGIQDPFDEAVFIRIAQLAKGE